MKTIDWYSFDTESDPLYSPSALQWNGITPGDIIRIIFMDGSEGFGTYVGSCYRCGRCIFSALPVLSPGLNGMPCSGYTGLSCRCVTSLEDEL